jgi:hypothetical protein
VIDIDLGLDMPILACFRLLRIERYTTLQLRSICKGQVSTSMGISFKSTGERILLCH